MRLFGQTDPVYFTMTYCKPDRNESLFLSPGIEHWRIISMRFFVDALTCCLPFVAFIMILTFYTKLLSYDWHLFENIKPSEYDAVDLLN